MPMLDIKNNPWLGLASYKVQDAELFHGREVETDALSEIIRKNYCTIIYGKSGMGKTSLINAGLIPALSAKGFVPLSIKLEHNGSVSYSEQIIQAVRSSVESAGGEVETSGLLGEDVPSDCMLWAFFHTSVFWSADNHRVIPVVFIDQFEEIFTIAADRQKVKEFFGILGELFQPLPPDGISGQIETQGLYLDFSESANFRLVLSMREDFLARLEDYSRDVPILKRNRVGLSAMNGLQALEVMMDPAPGLIDRAVAIRILRKICKDDRITDDEVSLRSLDVETFILSLFCSQLYKKAVELSQDHITAGIVERFGENIINDYYTECVKSISRTSLKYLEEHLLTASGYRNMLAYEDVVPQHVSKEEIAYLEKCRLIRIEVINKTERIEFTHDVLCGVAAAHRIDDRHKNELRIVRETVACNVLELLLLGTIYAAVLSFALKYSFGHLPDGFLSNIGALFETKINGYGAFLRLINWFMLLLAVPGTFFSFATRSALMSSSVKSKAFFLFASASSFVTLMMLLVLICSTIPRDSGYFVMAFIALVLMAVLEVYELMKSRSKSSGGSFRKIWKSALTMDDLSRSVVYTVKAVLVLDYIFLVLLSGIGMYKFLCLLIFLGTLPFILLLVPKEQRSALLEKRTRRPLLLAEAGIVAMFFSRYLGLGFVPWLLEAVLLVATYWSVSNIWPRIGNSAKIPAAVAIWLLFFMIIPTVSAGYNLLALGNQIFVKHGYIENLDRKLCRIFIIVRDDRGRSGVVDRHGNILLPSEFSRVINFASYQEHTYGGDVYFRVDNYKTVKLSDYLQYDNWYTRLMLPVMEQRTSGSIRAFIEDCMTQASIQDSLQAKGQTSMRGVGSILSEKIDELYDRQLVDEMLCPDTYLAMAKYYHFRLMPENELEMLSKALQYQIALDSTSSFLASGGWLYDEESVVSALANASVYLVSNHIYDGYFDAYKEYFTDAEGYQNFVKEVVTNINPEDFMESVEDDFKYDDEIISIVGRNYEPIALRNSEFNRLIRSIYERGSDNFGVSKVLMLMGEYGDVRQRSLSEMEVRDDSNSFYMAAKDLVTSLVFLDLQNEACQVFDEYRDAVVCIDGAYKFFRDWITEDMRTFERYGIISDIPASKYSDFMKYIGAGEHRNYQTLAYSPQYGVYWAGFGGVNYFNFQPFGLGQNGKLYVMDEHGERVTENFDDVLVSGLVRNLKMNSFEYDPVVVYGKDGKFGFYDMSRREYVTGAEFDHAWVFSEGLAGVEIDGLAGFIDSSGEIVIPLQYEFSEGLDYLFEGGYAKVYARDSYYSGLLTGLIDRKGTVVLPIEYNYVGSPLNGLRLFRKDMNRGVMDASLDVLYFGDKMPIIIDDGYRFVDRVLSGEVFSVLEGVWECEDDHSKWKISTMSEGTFEIGYDESELPVICCAVEYGGDVYLYKRDTEEYKKYGKILSMNDDFFEFEVAGLNNPEQTVQVRRYVRVE